MSLDQKIIVCIATGLASGEGLVADPQKWIPIEIREQCHRYLGEHWIRSDSSERLFCIGPDEKMLAEIANDNGQWRLIITPEQIKAARKFLGLTQAQMALVLGYDNHANYHRIERGDRKPDKARVRLLKAYLEGYRPEDWPS